MAGWCLDNDGPKQKELYVGLFDGKAAWRGVWDGRHLYSNLDYKVLYDHQTDPYEMNNLFDNPDFLELKAKMQHELEQLAEETGDPLLGSIKNANNSL